MTRGFRRRTSIGSCPIRPTSGSFEERPKNSEFRFERVILTVQEHGNTSAASIPLALSVARQQKKLERGQIILTEAIGGGLTWGAAVLRW